MRRPPLRLAVWSGTCLVGLPTGASAHMVGTGFGDFYAGALHLLLFPDAVLGLVALALFASLQPRDAVRWLLAALPISVFAGVLAGPWLLRPPEPWIAPGLLVGLGLGVAAAIMLPPALLAGLTAGLGLCVGVANGREITAPVVLTSFAAGCAMAGFWLFTPLAALLAVAVERASWMRIGIRAAGSWIAAVGLLLLGLAASPRGATILQAQIAGHPLADNAATTAAPR